MLKKKPNTPTEGDDTLNGSASNDVILALGGDDVVFGRGGNDQIEGGAGEDTLDGGDGDDLLIGGAGDDVMRGGGGLDRFTWGMGDGNDAIEGGSGSDRLDLSASTLADDLSVSARDSGLIVTAPFAQIIATDLEQLVLRTFHDSDEIAIGDLTGSTLRNVTIDVGFGLSGGLGDSAGDAVTLTGSAKSDKVVIAGLDGGVDVTGLAAEFEVLGCDTFDLVRFSAGAGNDEIDAHAARSGAPTLILDGGAGNDRLTGGVGGDTLIGVSGDDVLVGGAGDDTLDGGDGSDRATGGQGDDHVGLGDGDDTFTYRTGDGDDLVIGGVGDDTIHVVASAGSDSMLITKIDADLRLSDNLQKGARAFGVEHVTWFAGAGIDDVRVADTSDTGLTDILLDFAAKEGGKHGDGEVDFVSLFGTNGSDLIELRGTGDTVTVFGMSALVTAVHLDRSDQVIVRGGEGNDLLLVSTSAPDPARFTIMGEGGDDVIFGGNGDETLEGGLGDDEIGGGGGQDVMTGGVGADLFDFFSPADSRGRVDVIKDFSHLEGDRIDLSAMGTVSVTPDHDALQFIDTAKFSGAPGELRVVYDANGATLAADVDGDKVADFELRLNGVTIDHALILGDFIL